MEQTPKQQVVDRVNQANNVLVTVVESPSIDELASALGLTLMLNKLGKHTTAVFSGRIPPVMGFLDPGKTFENNVDSLRDFIISLDKEKADKLRYKVEDNVVKIFITPYRTKINESDLQFSQGDFNVDVVIALGVGNRDGVDEAIRAHGRILHDATVITINAGNKVSNMGAINWHEPDASSLAEMLVSISEAFQGGLLDGQIATALLTGIIAATNRFSSDKTTPKVMTMAAQLMAAGANQQLIAQNLETEFPDMGGKKSGDTTELTVDHDDKKKGKKKGGKKEEKLPPIDLSKAPKDATFKPPKLDELEKASKNLQKQQEEERLRANGQIKSNYGKTGVSTDEPTLGGTFNATADEALADKNREDNSSLNHQILSHDNTEPPTQKAPPLAPMEPPAPEVVSPPIQQMQPSPSNPPLAPMTPPLPPTPTPSTPTPSVPMASQPASDEAQPIQNDEAARQQAIEQARQDVMAAANAAPYSPANDPLQALNAQPLGPPPMPLTGPTPSPQYMPTPPVGGAPLPPPPTPPSGSASMPSTPSPLSQNNTWQPPGQGPPPTPPSQPL